MNSGAGAALGAPMLMGTDMRKRVSVSLELELHARAGEAARQRKTSNSDREDLGPFCAWCVKQILSLDFLCEENREFLQGILTQLGRPWTTLDVLDAIVSTFRKEVRAGRLRPFFCPGQAGHSGKTGAL
ncbi:MAG TPA: hypothetical protein VKQ28_14695 [Candidatus Acidoferrum sp.]|nr:hypothetical protein [Candidatus Acidoferrum sp.]